MTVVEDIIVSCLECNKKMSLDDAYSQCEKCEEDETALEQRWVFELMCEKLEKDLAENISIKDYDWAEDQLNEPDIYYKAFLEGRKSGLRQVVSHLYDITEDFQWRPKDNKELKKLLEFVYRNENK